MMRKKTFINIIIINSLMKYHYLNSFVSGDDVVVVVFEQLGSGENEKYGTGGIL